MKTLRELWSKNCWLKFVKNIENVDNLSIGDFENIKNLSIILRSLKTFKSNPKFRYRNSLRFRENHIIEDSDGIEKVQTGCEFYKIIVDMKKKKLSKSAQTSSKNAKSCFKC